MVRRGKVKDLPNVKNTIILEESNICREYWVNVKAYQNMVQKNPKILYEFICQFIKFQLCFWFILQLLSLINTLRRGEN